MADNYSNPVGSPIGTVRGLSGFVGTLPEDGSVQTTDHDSVFTDAVVEQRITIYGDEPWQLHFAAASLCQSVANVEALLAKAATSGGTQLDLTELTKTMADRAKNLRGEGLRMKVNG